MKKRLTPALARTYFSDPAQIPASWASAFAKPRFKELLQAFSYGFLLVDKEGQILSSYILPSTLQLAHGISTVSVYVANKEKKVFSKALKILKKKGDSFIANQLQSLLAAHLETLDDFTVKHMDEAAYRDFYAKGIPHHITLCNEAFFLNFPDAKRR